MRPAICVLLLIPLLGCSKSQPKPAAEQSAATAKSPTSAQPDLLYASLADAPPPAHVDGNRAMSYTREVTAFGPRPMGSEAHKKLETYLREHLKNDNLEEDTFTAHTPLGDFSGRNFIARFPGSKDGMIVISGHYDTLMNRPDFVGANDGGSSTGLLLALADQLKAQRLNTGYTIVLVWFDGEEAVKQWTNTDSVYGSRHLAEKWQNDGTLKKIKAFFLVDMIGDRDLDVVRDTNSTASLLDIVYSAASRLGDQSYFFQMSGPISDDHIPFVQRGVPCVDIIDLDYGYQNVFWHTREDTLDKLSPQSMSIVGSTVMESIRMLNGR